MPYTLPSTATIDAAKTGSQGLNLREAPSTAGRRLATMPVNARLAVVGVARQGFDPAAPALWYQVRYLRHVGFCAASFLALDAGSTIPLPAAATVDPQKTPSTGLNLRAAPEANGRLLATMPQNAPMQIVGAAREGLAANGALWYHVQFGAQRGYCLADFLITSSTPGVGLTGPAVASGTFVGAWPVGLSEHVVTAPFNQPRPSFSSPIKAHEGIDLRAPNGVPVVAWADGRVAMRWEWDGATRSGNHAYGHHVKLFHPALGLYSMYCHLQSFDVVKDQVMQMGERIGLADNTGNSTGAHLHFMIVDPVNGLNGYVYPKVVDPTPYLPQPYTIL